MTKTILHTSSQMKVTLNPEPEIIHLKYNPNCKRLFMEAKKKVRAIYDSLVKKSDNEENIEYLHGGFSALTVLVDSLSGGLSTNDVYASLMLVSISVYDRMRRRARMAQLPEAFKKITNVAVVTLFYLPLPPAIEFADFRSIRANLESRIEEASLRSHEQAMVMLCASKSQVRRGRESGELKATWLDSHPHYQPQHIKAFIDSRTKQGMPIKKSNIAHPAKNAVCAQSKKNRPATKKAKTKKKELS